MSSDDLPSQRLPPRPDPETGEPFPPHAAVYEGVSSAKRKKIGEIDIGEPPEPPPEQGPTLAWYQASRNSPVFVFAIYFVGLLVLGILYAYFDDLDLSRILATWWVWVVIFLFSLIPALSVRGARCSAGAEWVRDRRQWVRIYELDSIKAKPYGSGLWLELRDQHGRDFDTQIMTLQYNRRLWDLLYNGMLHSATNGATVNSFARRAFRLPDPTATDQPSTGATDDG